MCYVKYEIYQGYIVIDNDGWRNICYFESFNY